MRDGRHRHRHGQLPRLLERRAGQVVRRQLRVHQAQSGTGYVNPYATCQVNAARANGIREAPTTSPAHRPAARKPRPTNSWPRRGRAAWSPRHPVLDWEPSAPGGYWGKQTWWALRWVNRVKATWGVNPMIYMSAAMIPTGDWSAVVATNAGLWVAGYPRGYAGDRLRNPGASRTP